jgi:hypothetical protein
MPAFHNDDERAAWTLAESLMEQGRSLTHQAETALEKFAVGKELNRQRCSRRGIGTSDAEIRWSETPKAQKALSENSFNVSQAMLYYAAAAAHYARAAYLRSQGARY